MTDATCIDCGTPVTGMHKRCAKCDRIIRDKRSAEAKRRRRELCGGDGYVPAWRLVYDPRGMEWWGDMPVFSTTDIRETFGYSTWNTHMEYPFEPGCKFENVRTGARKEVKVGCDGRLVFKKVEA